METGERKVELNEVMQIVQDQTPKAKEEAVKTEEAEEAKQEEKTDEIKDAETEEKKDEDLEEKKEDKKGTNWEDFGATDEEGAKQIFSTFTQEKSDFEKEKKEWIDKEKVLADKLKKRESLIDDPTLLRLNKVKTDKPEEFSLYSSLVLNKDGIKPIDLLKLKFIQDNPNYKEQPDKVDIYIKDKYGLGLKELTEDDEHTAEDVITRKHDIDMNKMRMDVDATKVKNELLGKFEGIELPKAEVEKTKEEIQIESDNLKKSWTTYLDKLVKEFKTIPVFFKGAKDDKRKEFMKFEVSEEFKKEIIPKLMDYAVNRKLPVTEDSLKDIAQFMMYEFEQTNKAMINSAMIKMARSMTDEEWIGEVHHPTALEAKDKKDKSADQSKQQKGLDEVEAILKEGGMM